MPLLLAIPIIAGLAGLFVGTQVENKINNPTQPVGSQQSSALPWYVTLTILIVGSIIVLIVIKKILKRF